MDEASPQGGVTSAQAPGPLLPAPAMVQMQGKQENKMSQTIIDSLRSALHVYMHVTETFSRVMRSLPLK